MAQVFDRLPKYKRQMVQRIVDSETPYVIECRGKHGIGIYDASTPERFFASLIAIVRDRMWIYQDNWEHHQNVAVPQVPENVSTLIKENAGIFPKVARELSRSQREAEAIKEAIYEARWTWETARLAIEQLNPVAAWAVLDQRSDYEYEGFDIRPMDVSEPREVSFTWKVQNEM